MPAMQHVPVDLMLAMRDRYGLQQFVETGTYHGQSALLATGYFDLVTTCDIDPELSGRIARIQLPPPKQLRSVCCASEKLLQQMFAYPEHVKPALVWLDAHWSCGPKLGPECPLIRELAAIGGTHGRHVILCDDARLFLAPPPPPHDPEQWPTFDEIVVLCRELGPEDVVEVIGDVIVIRPC